MKILVLGTGLVGGPIAADLARDTNFEVGIADINPVKMNMLGEKYPVKTYCCDLKNPDMVKEIIKEYDMAVNAVPGFMGFSTLKALTEAGKNVVDIAFFPEDMFLLDHLAKEKNVTIVSDMGVAPGMSHLLTGYGASMLDKVEKAIIYVGGLPKIRQWPYEYKAVFSPVDVLEEYTRSARVIENGKEIIKSALSEAELIDFPKIGTLEAFVSDGLRSLTKTIPADYMVEKTLRYKGHIELMKIFRESGFFDTKPVQIQGQWVSPLEFTSKLLFPKWKLEEGEEDITVMQIIVEGQKNGRKLRFTWNLYDTYDKVTETHSMARTTGYAATAAVRLLASGLYAQKGVSAPEFIGKHPECVQYMLDRLKERGICYQETKEDI
ncbi:MAG: saccharopine dehydrogenase NADP-binding domain-containing protein [Lentimicrobiaceae bacterium]|jgi:saccharopine dehydrogenase-like NADP-dependent oxidoreductase|nr:saccharopine dehydrogenase NADP-binding domain-containing protein [Lentimicrobiaceae bacterium]